MNLEAKIYSSYKLQKPAKRNAISNGLEVSLCFSQTKDQRFFFIKNLERCLECIRITRNWNVSFCRSVPRQSKCFSRNDYTVCMSNTTKEGSSPGKGQLMILTALSQSIYSGFCLGQNGAKRTDGAICFTPTWFKVRSSLFYWGLAEHH